MHHYRVKALLFPLRRNLSVHYCFPIHGRQRVLHRRLHQDGLIVPFMEGLGVRVEVEVAARHSGLEELVPFERLAIPDCPVVPALPDYALHGLDLLNLPEETAGPLPPEDLLEGLVPEVAHELVRQVMLLDGGHWVLADPQVEDIPTFKIDDWLLLLPEGDVEGPASSLDFGREVVAFLSLLTA